MKRHGWQLPLHRLQVFAIVVFFCLVAAFYLILAPFLGNEGLVITLIVLYTPVAFAVFFLYIRCTAIDPGDTGISIQLPFKPSSGRAVDDYVTAQDRTPVHDSFVTPVHDSFAIQEALHSLALQSGRKTDNSILSTIARLSRSPHMCFSEADDCKRESSTSQAVTNSLNCVLCNKRVSTSSKHCKSCDKCVYGFDHHCKWINNCVGKKNYFTFIALMAVSLTLLLVEGLTGSTVIVRCLFHNNGITQKIEERLGSRFSKGSFAAVVAICTGASLMASAAVGELLLFHILLIKKGISTYEYVVAMRARSEHQSLSTDQENVHNPPVSPVSSIMSSWSGSSALGAQYRRAWCTPPRVYLDSDRQEEVAPHLGSSSLPSTVDPDNSAAQFARAGRHPVRISPWQLARLDVDEAARLVAKARERSAGRQQLPVFEKRVSIQGASSCRSSVHEGSFDHSFALRPLPLETKCNSVTSSPRYSEIEISPIRLSSDFSSSPVPRQLWPNTSSSPLSASASLLSSRTPQEASILRETASLDFNDSLQVDGTSIFFSGPLNVPTARRDDMLSA